MKGYIVVKRTRCVSVWKPRSFSIKKALQPISAYGLTLAICGYPTVSLAGPDGGVITGGMGTINQSGATTTIQQTTQNMAIDWQSYNVAVDERVHYIQPNTSSISLNRILSNQGSTIAAGLMPTATSFWSTPTASCSPPPP